MAKSIQDITEIIKKFREDRGWANDIPTELITALTAEFGELAEHYLWKKEFWELSEEEKDEIGFEFVDVLFYLFTLADHSGIDIEKAFDKKVPLLEKKFPVDATNEEHRKARKEYKKSGKNRLYS
ncbi:dUTP diphosphatase [Candidatus Dojkabacteria bacterium]|uniref:dUTP diphosphatase n=1 Tax=Candidatus Dojkabacteria bacterium TaxID=2099670 RepID=A0A955L9F7_9BACT|nr:dUTP diphosphatase [Candidatus Dojkabacteria bacterium]